MSRSENFLGGVGFGVALSSSSSLSTDRRSRSLISSSRVSISSSCLKSLSSMLIGRAVKLRAFLNNFVR